MPCFHPLAAFRSKEINPKTGKNFVFIGSGDKPHPGKEYFNVPCGKCVGCRLERGRQWAMRCYHESKMWEKNCFITLTFNEDNVQKNHSLDKSDFVLFMKRLRKRFGSKIRFFHCGEYGLSSGRPHHHACLFNFDFPDKILWRVKNGVRLYRSKALEELWPFGFCTVGDVTFESAAYVARYILKKVERKYYDDRVKEYISMSRKPGIGMAFFEKFKDDIYPHDFVVVNGFKHKPARFYDEKYLLTDKDDFDILKDKRIEAAKANPDNIYSRLRPREVVTEAKVANMRREI